MTKHLQRYMESLLEGKSFESDDELYLFLTLSVAAGFVAIVHVILVLIFFCAQMSLMLIFTLISLVVDSSCIFLLRRRCYEASGYMITISVSCYTLLTVYFLGASVYAVFYLLAVLLMQVTIPYTGKGLRKVVIAMLFLVFCVSIYAHFRYTPQYDLGGLLVPLAFINMSIGFVGTVAQLSIANIVRQIISHYNESKMESYKRQAHTDSLTGLYNRRYAEKFFEQIARHQPENWCVAMMDVDDFKHINDTYGHNTGDVVLRVIAETMRDMLRKTDMLIRWGGEEFLLFLCGVDLETATAILDKMRSTIGDTQIISEGRTVSVTVTIGITALDPADIIGSIGICDTKLYEGKKDGKNKVTAA